MGRLLDRLIRCPFHDQPATPLKIATMDMTTTGLPLEYQGNYGTASGDLDIADLINNPEANGLCRVHGMSLRGR